MNAEKLTDMANKLRRDQGKADISRANLHSAILDALAEGVTQADVARATGYTREHLRRLAVAADPTRAALKRIHDETRALGNL